MLTELGGRDKLQLVETFLTCLQTFRSNSIKV